MPAPPTDEERIGMAWWNRLTSAQRYERLMEAQRVLGRPASPGEAFRIWRDAHQQDHESDSPDRVVRLF